MKINIFYSAFVFLILMNCTIQSQSFYNSKIELKVKDQAIELFELNSEDQTTIRKFYSLPSNLQLSINENGQAEFLFMSYKKEGSSEVEVIMHWILNMGFNKLEVQMIDSIVKLKVDSNAIYAGQLLMDPIGNIQYKMKDGNAELLEIIKSGLNSGGIAPILSNNKSAAAFRFKGLSAEKMVECITHPKLLKGIFIEMNYLLPNSDFIPFQKNKSNQNIISVSLGLDKLFEKAKTCKECIIMSN